MTKLVLIRSLQRLTALENCFTSTSRARRQLIAAGRRLTSGVLAIAFNAITMSSYSMANPVVATEQKFDVGMGPSRGQAATLQMPVWKYALHVINPGANVFHRNRRVFSVDEVTYTRRVANAVFNPNHTAIPIHMRAQIV